MASGAAKNKTLEHKRFVRTRMAFTQSLLVTVGALKLDYTSVIFVDPRVQIDSLTTAAAYQYARFLVVHISARPWLSTNKTPV